MKRKIPMIKAFFLIYLFSFKETQARTIPGIPRLAILRLDLGLIIRDTVGRRNGNLFQESLLHPQGLETETFCFSDESPFHSGQPPLVVKDLFTCKFNACSKNPHDELRKTNYGKTLNPTTLSLTSSPPSQEITRDSSCNEDHSCDFFSVKTRYEMTSSPPPPSPTPAPTIKQISSASPCDEEQSCNFFARMTHYERTSSPPPPSPASAPATKQISRAPPCPAASPCNMLITTTSYERTSSSPPPPPKSSPPTHQVASIGLLLFEKSPPNPILAST